MVYLRLDSFLRQEPIARMFSQHVVMSMRIIGLLKTSNTHITPFKTLQYYHFLFHIEMCIASRPCPMCRCNGPFVQLGYCFEKALCSAEPTHVFNPCGHAISKERAELWSQISFSCAFMDDPRCRPRCPFCAGYVRKH